MVDAPKIQSLMDQAYGRWQRAEGMSKEDFWDTLDADERKAVFVGNFNYQVCNGGFVQWHDNGYATEEVVGLLMRLCKRMDTSTSRAVLELLKEFDRARKNYYEFMRMDEDDTWHRFCSETDGLDTRFYAINDQFVVEVEATL